MKLRICIYAQVLDVGGMESWAVNLCLGLRALGHDCWIATKRRRSAFDTQMLWLDPDNKAVIKVFEHPDDFEFMGQGISKNCDICISSQPSNADIEKNITVPTIGMFHGKFSVTAATTKICRRFITPSDILVDDIRKKYPMTPIDVVYHGVNLDNLPFDSTTRHGVGFVGRLCQYKFRLLEATADARRDNNVEVKVFTNDVISWMPFKDKLYIKPELLTSPGDAWRSVGIGYGVGIVALEIMASGAILMRPMERPLEYYMKRNFLGTEIYDDHAAKSFAMQDLKKQLDLTGTAYSKGVRVEQRKHVEEHHSHLVMAEKVQEAVRKI